MVEAARALPTLAATPSTLLRWIPLLPLIAAVVHGVMLGLLRRTLSRGAVIALSVGSVIASFLLSVVAFGQLIGLPEGQRAFVDDVYTWIGAGRFSAEMSFLLDPLSAVMILVVTGVGSLIHVYSVGYMDDDHRDDKGFQRFFCYLNLFTFSMLMLVLGDNLLVLFLGWEGVGLCSYLLIGFWYMDKWNAYCGSKAFIVNRIGDFGFLLGIFLLFSSLAAAGHPTVAFRDIAAAFPRIAEQTVQMPDLLGGGEWKLATLIGVLFFVGAMGKSAQIPLYVWLPDAMAGPTPVSALIHAATMVTAGVYMVCRLNFVYTAGPGAAALVAWIGGVTALFAATIAITQTDIKKVLAYSTVSQLGYMFVAAGCGAFSGAIFHLATHAFFKALLFLGAGSVILAMHHEQDVDKMGGLRKAIPITHWTFLVGVLAISGIPFFSGFFSKDEILLAAHGAEQIPGHEALWAVGLFTAGLTALYMFRLYFRTFHGSFRGTSEQLHHVHEPAQTVLVPLVVLAVLSAAGGLIGVPQVYGDILGVKNANSLAHFLAQVVGLHEAEVPQAEELRLAALAVLVASIGIALAWWLYVQAPSVPQRVRESVGWAYRLLFGKYYVDELYDMLFVNPLKWISENVFYKGVDAGLVDGVLVNGSANAVQAVAARALKYLQSGFAQSYLFFMVAGALAIVAWLVV
jgi:NADH-quinone oxidoreductase subunit L